MKFTGDVLFSVDTVKITNLQGEQQLCAECFKPLRGGEEIVVFTKTQVLEQSDRTISIPLQSLYFIHVKGREKGSCIEDFIARFIQNTPELVNSNVIDIATPVS